MNKREIGNNFEKIAGEYLKKKGFLILEYNYRCRMGEIDIIGIDGEALVFVEVKYRKDKKGGHPLEAVNAKKQKTICRVADYYRMIHQIPENRACRFDVVGMLPGEIVHVENAFAYIGT